jgi:presequence protease
MARLTFSTGQRTEGFTIERMQEIPELRSTALIALHEKSGARLVHLINEDPNNLFAIAFRTPASDDTGAPHILEHSVLCGSRKFPIKDPFQELLKGSLQTFLNALTYPDKTVYPVSSQVEADFFNLVDVYCDATFHPLLSQNTFFQEGWHFDLEKEDDPVNIKGIVYNEMKGVFSDFSSHVERKTIAHLFPDIAYRYESGGLPEHIIDLTYEKFKAFHAHFYHPSNSFIFLYGNIPSEKTLKFLSAAYLNDYRRIDVASEIEPQPLWDRPRRMEMEAPAPDSDDGFATVALSWIFGDTIDATSSLVGSVLYHYLLGTESAPLKRALIDSRLGEDLDDITGFTAEFVQSVFCVGLRKTRPDRAEAVFKIVSDTLASEAENGLDEELLEGSIRQIEFRLREISDAGRFPYNLLLAERCFRSWLYGGDPLAYLAFEKNIAFVRDKKNGGSRFFSDKLRKLLLENKHRLLTVIKASVEMGKKLETQTSLHAERLGGHFTESDKTTCRHITEQLIREQKMPNAPEALAALPRLKKTDLPQKNRDVPATMTSITGRPAYLHPLFTSGIVYLDIGFDCSAVPRNLLDFLPLYVRLASSCGAAGFSYEAMAKKVALATGGIHGSLLCETKAGENEALVFDYFLHGKALMKRVADMMSLFSDLLLAPDLSNTTHINNLLFEMRNDLNASVIGSGHLFAVTHSASRLIKSKYFDELLGGITQLRFLDGLLKRFDAPMIVEKMETLHTLLVNKSRCMVSVTADDPDAVIPEIAKLLSKLPEKCPASADLTFNKRLESAYGIEISSSVNFTAKTWKCKDFGPLDIGHYYVLSKNLSTEYLWNKVRVEGGAYGGMAPFSSGHPVFSCASYRDPNLLSTLRHFETGLSQIVSHLDSAGLDQSIIATIGRMDTPKTPHEKGFDETVALLCGRSRDFRATVRESVLGATPESIRQIARRLLDEKETAITVLGGGSALEEAQKEGLELNREALL